MKCLQQNEDAPLVCVLACMHVCVHACSLALPSSGWDSVFSCSLLSHLSFRSVAECRLRPVGTSVLENLEKPQFLCCRCRLPPVHLQQ